MFQPNFDEQPSRESSARFSKLAFVVGEPTEVRPDRDDARPAGDDEETQWLHERLTDCYND
jgi:hypothetical protein